MYGPHSGKVFKMRGKTRGWELERVRVLGKGSYGTAFLVRDLLSLSNQQGATTTGSTCTSGENGGEGEGLFVAKEINIMAVRKPAEIEALHKEISILKRVQHPNVVRYVDCTAADDPSASQLLVIIMEYCDGGDLHDRITAFGKEGMPEDEIASILIQVFIALRHLHLDHRILHRDLKPQNIFLTQEGVVKIGDFGVSTTLSQSVDYAKTFCGSPYYLAPELCEEKPYNGKADLWSVGVILYECLSKGERPFAARNLMALVMQIGKAQYSVEPLQSYSTELQDIVSVLLQRMAINRPTFARLLRIPYVKDHLYTVPASLLNSQNYTTVLGEKAAHRALEVQSSYEEQTGGALMYFPAPGSVAGELNEELKQWANKDKEQLAALEKAQGLKGKAFDDDFMTERQKRELRGEVLSPSTMSPPPSPEKNSSTVAAPCSSSGGSSEHALHRRRNQPAPQQLNPQSSSGVGELELTAEDDDEAWNSRYDDEDFESADTPNSHAHLPRTHSTTAAGLSHQTTSTAAARPGTSTAITEKEDADELAWLQEEERKESKAYEEWWLSDAVPMCEQSYSME